MELNQFHAELDHIFVLLFGTARQKVALVHNILYFLELSDSVKRPTKPFRFHSLKPPWLFILAFSFKLFKLFEEASRQPKQFFDWPNSDRLELPVEGLSLSSAVCAPPYFQLLFFIMKDITLPKVQST